MNSILFIRFIVTLFGGGLEFGRIVRILYWV